MTTDPTSTTHAVKAEAARQAARSSGLGSPAAMYFLGVAQTHALLEVAEQLRLANLIALAQVQLPSENVDAGDLVDVVELLALRPDIAAALGVQS